MYKAPIEIFRVVDDIIQQVEKGTEKAVHQAVIKCGVNVDKEELKKALMYDREQYVKGYADGMKEFAERLQDMLGDPFLREHYDVCIVIDNILAEVTPNFTKVDHSSLCETETYEGDLKG